MITYDGKTLRNLQEQVEKNKEDILFILEQEGTLNQFGIKVIGQADTAAELPTVADYKAAHADWAYGDTYAIGTESPYVLDVLTRSNGTHPNDYWFNIGTFPLAGPKGDKGDTGIGIDTMQVIDFPNGTPQVTYDTTDGTKVHGKMLITYMDGNKTVTKEISNVTVEIPVVYKNGLKANAAMNNDMVEVQVDGEKIMKMPELDKGNFYLAVATGKWYSGTSSTKPPDVIQWRDFQKNVKNNAMVQRTENGNIMLPDNFPSDAGGGKDVYGNVIDQMSVPKSYVDRMAGGISWHTDAPNPTTKALASKVQGILNLTIDGKIYSCSVMLFTWGYASKDSPEEGTTFYTGWNYGTITVSAYDNSEYIPLYGIGVPVYAIDSNEFHVNIDKNGKNVSIVISPDDLNKLPIKWLY